ncbi:uncharacterized protein LOC133860239 [Alnus glutinosa]|uniref:uncharacterized protein LOC133860239 n=1 Tax=Alnus glutinosa TaxID=3517 RepID=UPI002D79931B|nr:uncharacterized protein LOC133860239 [Alnus glutinosa]
MCVIDLDLCFTYVYTGKEGSAHDSRIFTMCVNDLTLSFPTPKESSFYLVDSGYGCYQGFLPLKYNGMIDPLFEVALRRLNPWVDADDQQEVGMAQNIAPREQPDQSNASSNYMGKVRDVMTLSM